MNNNKDLELKSVFEQEKALQTEKNKISEQFKKKTEEKRKSTEEDIKKLKLEIQSIEKKLSSIEVAVGESSDISSKEVSISKDQLEKISNHLSKKLAQIYL